jgi:hypothetical protein
LQSKWVATFEGRYICTGRYTWGAKFGRNRHTCSIANLSVAHQKRWVVILESFMHTHSAVNCVPLALQAVSAMVTSGQPLSELWVAVPTMPWPLTIHVFPGIRDKPQYNLNPLRDSFSRPKFGTVPDVKGPVEGMA